MCNNICGKKNNQTASPCTAGSGHSVSSTSRAIFSLAGDRGKNRLECLIHPWMVPTSISSHSSSKRLPVIYLPPPCWKELFYGSGMVSMVGGRGTLVEEKVVTETWIYAVLYGPSSTWVCTGGGSARHEFPTTLDRNICNGFSSSSPAPNLISSQSRKLVQLMMSLKWHLPTDATT